MLRSASAALFQLKHWWHLQLISLEEMLNSESLKETWKFLKRNRSRRKSKIVKTEKNQEGMTVRRSVKLANTAGRML